MNRSLLVIAFLLGLASQTSARGPELNFSLQGGFTIGSPYGDLPENVDELKWDPVFTPSLGLILDYPFQQRFSLGLGIKYAQRSSKITTVVRDRYNINQGIFGVAFPLLDINVPYVASAEGEISNHYLDIPIYLKIHLGNWQLHTGYQFSYLLDGSFVGTVGVRVLLLPQGTVRFDESEKLRSTDHALLLGLGRTLTNRLTLMSQLTYGLSHIFSPPPSGLPNLRNLYGNLLLSYNFNLNGMLDR